LIDSEDACGGLGMRVHDMT